MTTATFHGKILDFFNKKRTFLFMNFDIKLNFYINIIYLLNRSWFWNGLDWVSFYFYFLLGNQTFYQ